jgi:hypothetical protein
MNLTKRMLAARVDYNEYVAKCNNASRVVLYIKNR